MSAGSDLKGCSVINTDRGLSDQQRLNLVSDATIGETERLIVIAARPAAFCLVRDLALLLDKQSPGR